MSDDATVTTDGDMRDDLVRRLRSGMHRGSPLLIGDVMYDGRCLEAADEIERLRAERDAALAQAAEARRQGAEEMREWCLGEACPPSAEITAACGPLTQRDLKVIRAFKTQISDAIRALPVEGGAALADAAKENKTASCTQSAHCLIGMENE